MFQKSVIIASPDALQRRHLSTMFRAVQDFDIIDETSDLMSTYTQVEAKVPKAVLISECLANLPEFEVMRALFSTLDVRWLVVTQSGPDRLGRPRPQHEPQPGSDLFAVSAQASADVLVQQLRSLTRTKRASAPSLSKNLGSSQEAPRHQPVPQSNRRVGDVQSTQPASGDRGIILIGSSTGGIDALLKVLSNFPENCPPTLIVQHTGVGFGESLAGLLNRQCAPSVELVRAQTVLRRGAVLIGAGTRAHLVLRNENGLVADLLEAPAVSGHRPSVDVLFKSARPIAKKVTAAILTGMGRDGADGLKELRDAGAQTMAQDEATSVVYGMPRAAVENGATETVLPLTRIGPALLAGQNEAHTIRKRIRP